MQLMSVHTSVGDTGINCIRALVWKRHAEHVGSSGVVAGFLCVYGGHSRLTAERMLTPVNSSTSLFCVSDRDSGTGSNKD